MQYFNTPKIMQIHENRESAHTRLKAGGGPGIPLPQAERRDGRPASAARQAHQPPRPPGSGGACCAGSPSACANGHIPLRAVQLPRPPSCAGDRAREAVAHLQPSVPEPRQASCFHLPGSPSPSPLLPPPRSSSRASSFKKPPGPDLPSVKPRDMTARCPVLGTPTWPWPPPPPPASHVQHVCPRVGRRGWAQKRGRP